ncbi:MAG: hypothetical protein AB7O66_16330, partial [Limisphaerales bacterium]
LVEQVLGEIEQEVLGRDGCVLMTNVGLLARYGRLNFLSQLQNAVLQASSGSRTLWVLVPSNRQTLLPTLHGQPVPVPTPAQWARVPEGWTTFSEAA